MVSFLTGDDSHEAALAAQLTYEEGYVREFASEFRGERTIHHTDNSHGWVGFVRGDQQPDGTRPKSGDEVHHAALGRG